MREVAKGIDLMRLNSLDPAQAEGPLVCDSLAYHWLRQFDVPLPLQVLLYTRLGRSKTDWHGLQQVTSASPSLDLV